MRKKIKFNFQAVIFDMDGVITNTMPYHFDAWLETFRQAGVRINCYDIYKREGQDGLTSVKEIAKEYKIRLKPDEAKRLLAQKEERFKRIVKIKFVKGSRPFVRHLKKQGFLLALVTGTSRHEMHRIMPQGLLDMFDVIITGNDVTKGKPDPEPFVKVLQRLGVNASEAVVLENAPFGIEAAKKARLSCIALQTSLPKKYLFQADAIFKSYAQLRRAIDF